MTKRSGTFPDTERDFEYLARNRRRAWFDLAAATEDLLTAKWPGDRSEAEKRAASALHRLRSLGVPRADPSWPDSNVLPKERDADGTPAAL